MKMNTLFLDTEHGELITGFELFNEFLVLRDEGETDCQSFEEYIKEVTGKNGTLERVGN